MMPNVMTVRKLTYVALCVFMFMSLTVVSSPLAQAAETRLNIVAMGDSYTAGTGATNYFGPSGCYRSNGNYARKFATKVAATGVIIDYDNIACHGAVTKDLTNQLQQLSSRERKAVDLVFVTIGGNDGGFADIVKNCFVPLIKRADRCYNDIQDGFDSIYKFKSDTFNRLEEIATLMPDAKVILVGYPYPVDNYPKNCSYNMVLEDFAGFPVNSFSARDQVRTLADLLEAAQIQAINSLSSKYPGRFQFESVKSTFNGHENCGDKALWLRGSLDTTITGEWWHPNSEGYSAEADVLFSRQVHKGQADTFKYSNLPLLCGIEIKYISTYDSFTLNGITYYHSKSLDLPAASGTKVVAPVSGVAYVKYSSGYGNYIDLIGDDGKTHRMAHMLATGLTRNGSRVSQGQAIGLVGSTGASTGPHLHYEQRVSGSQVSVGLKGPALEWGPNLSSGGDRRTMHTVESSNCGSSTTNPGFDPMDELLFYRPTDGSRIYHDVATDGSQTQISRSNWKPGWDNVVALEIDGDDTSELLVYDAEATADRGLVSVHNMTSNGVSSPLNTKNWSNSWTHIVPIDLDGDNRDELLIYSAKSGIYYFMDISASGQFTVLRKANWAKGWKIIQAVEFDGTKGQELLFYKNGSDRASTRIYDVGTTGAISLRNTPNWSNGWTHIQPIDLSGDGTDELIVYNAVSGRYYTIDLATSGSHQALTSGDWSKGWDKIVPLEIDGDRYAELLFYKYETGDTTGTGALYDMNSYTASNLMQRFNWSAGWDIILAVQVK